MRCTRRFMVDWISYWGRKLDQSLLTVQTAIVYLDRIVNDHDLEVISNKYLWGATALLVASKFMEIDDKLINSDCFIYISKHSVFTKDEFTQCEKQICSLLDWQLIAYPPIYYFEAFIAELKDTKFVSACKSYWEIIIKLTEWQGYSYSAQFAAILQKSADKCANILNDIPQIMELLQCSEENLKRCYFALSDVDISNFQCYTPKPIKELRKSWSKQSIAYEHRKIMKASQYCRLKSKNDCNTKATVRNIKNMLKSNNNSIETASISSTVNAFGSLASFNGTAEKNAERRRSTWISKNRASSRGSFSKTDILNYNQSTISSIESQKSFSNHPKKLNIKRTRAKSTLIREITFSKTSTSKLHNLKPRCSLERERSSEFSRKLQFPCYRIFSTPW